MDQELPIRFMLRLLRFPCSQLNELRNILLIISTICWPTVTQLVGKDADSWGSGRENELLRAIHKLRGQIFGCFYPSSSFMNTFTK